MVKNHVPVPKNPGLVRKAPKLPDRIFPFNLPKDKCAATLKANEPKYQIENFMPKYTVPEVFNSYENMMIDVLENGKDILNDRTGKVCRVLINKQLTYDVGRELFPLVTTREAFYKTAINEFIGYMRGFNSAAQFRAIGCKTWDANANKTQAWLDNPNRLGEDDIGKAYRFRAVGYYTETPTIVKPKPSIQTGPRFPKHDVDMSSNKFGMVGNCYDSNSYGKFIVISEHLLEGTERTVLDIQFLLTGYVKRDVFKGEVTSGEVKDIYYPAVCGIACIGNIANVDKDIVALLKPVWNNMIGRCYEVDTDRSELYRSKGIWVCDRWLSFENFCFDFQRIPNWRLKKHNPKLYSLDKDFYRSNYYSPETCRWVTKKEQSVNTESVSMYKAVNIVTGVVHISKGAVNIIKETGDNRTVCENMRGLEMGVQYVHGEWSYSRIPGSTVSYYEVDQLLEIVAKLKDGVDDRGLIMTAWNKGLEEFAALRPCMHTHTFSMLGNTLHLFSLQRSCDVPLGLVFNMPQCYFLLGLMSRMTNLKAGKVVHHLNNVHIYEDQIPFAEEQVKRDPRSYSKLIWPDIDYSRTLDEVLADLDGRDFEVEGYMPHDPIAYPFSE